MRAGFSLVELMISVGIMSTTLLLVLGVFTNVMKASRKAVDLTAGTIVAEGVISTEMYAIMGDEVAKNLFFKKTYNDPFVEGTKHLNNSTFVYRMYATEIPIGTKVLTDNRVKKIDVIVWWWADGEGNVTTDKRAGYGYLRTELSRLVNENSKY